MPVEHQFRGTLSLAALLEAVDKHAPIYSVIAHEPEYFETIFLKDKTIPNKVLLSKPDEKVPLWWKGLTAKFLHRLDVGLLILNFSLLRSTQMNLLSTKNTKFPEIK